MKELANEIEGAMETIPDEEAEELLRTASIHWASFCLTTYNGKLLRKGLVVSKSIVEFLNQLEKDILKARTAMEER